MIIAILGRPAITAITSSAHTRLIKSQPSPAYYTHMHWRLLAIILSGFCASALADYDAASSRGTDLSGRWVLNAALSDDAEAMLEERLNEERERYTDWRRREERARAAAGVPGALEDSQEVGAGRSARQRPWQRQRYENFRRMLGITKVLTLRQEGARMEIESAVESRRFEAGTHTQVSMPEGQIADCEAGWDGEWFVIERKVRRGPRVVEKFRLLPKTDQLEYRMAWGGDTELSRMKVRRVFDRGAGQVAPHDPSVGPVR